MDFSFGCSESNEQNRRSPWRHKFRIGLACSPFDQRTVQLLNCIGSTYGHYMSLHLLSVSKVSMIHSNATLGRRQLLSSDCFFADELFGPLRFIQVLLQSSIRVRDLNGSTNQGNGS